MISWQNDHEYDTVTITSLKEDSKGWVATFNDGWCLGLPNNGVVPKVGDLVRRYGRGVGHTARGVVLNDKDVVYYRTAAEEKALREEEYGKYEEEKKRRYEESGRAKLDEAYESLPDVFKQRIDRFRKANPDFRWKYESYEMACCLDAVYLAGLLKTQDEVWKSSRVWRKGMVSDSGNQVECAYYLAFWYLKNPSTIPQIKGALSPLVGTADYSEAKERVK